MHRQIGKSSILASALLAAALCRPGAARADEIIGGVYAHDVKTGITASGFERGVDLQIGWRGDRIQALRAIGAPSPHAFVSVNSAGETNFAAAGISWKIGRQLYLRPGIGVAVHDGPSDFRPRERRILFGSRILFEPEIGVGAQLGERLSIEASWVHLSHGTLFGANNPGMDTIGVRFGYRY